MVLYWMIAARRTNVNYGLERTMEYARDLRKPLVVLEALRADHPWAADRFHQFVLAGMHDNRAALQGRPGITYSPTSRPARAQAGVCWRRSSLTQRWW
jgi:deoxyribodipyrimidine photo-lyase